MQQQWNKSTMSFYRRLLKSMMVTFKGDYEMFHRVRLEAKKKIREHKDLTDELDIQKQIFFGEECRDLLLKNLVQANLQDNGHYRLKLRKENTISPQFKQ